MQSSRLLHRDSKASFEPVRVSTVPSGSITVTSRTHSPMSPPWPPALPTSAPPTTPGIPTSVSRPESPACTAAETTCTSFAPAPARSIGRSTVMPQKAGAESRTTMPGKPADGTRMLEPPPITRRGTRSRWHRATSRASASTSTGSQKYPASPPIPSQVWWESGSRQETASPRSSKGVPPECASESAASTAVPVWRDFMTTST